jgi:hypothetical protein
VVNGVACKGLMKQEGNDVSYIAHLIKAIDCKEQSILLTMNEMQIQCLIPTYKQEGHDGPYIAHLNINFLLYTYKENQ